LSFKICRYKKEVIDDDIHQIIEACKIESDLIRIITTPMNLKIAVLSGDGIGPEVILQAKLCMPSGCVQP
jgi:hypothetical protein